MWNGGRERCATPIDQIFPAGITILTAANVKNHPHRSSIGRTVDELGRLSAISQNLKRAITTQDKLNDSDHNLYLAIDDHDNGGSGVAIGFLKIGIKRLFVTDGSEPARPADFPCLLDFYVREQYQRHGWGKHLFDRAIQNENIKPQNMAFDRPSEKLIRFLAKHYSLTDAIEQPNRYVIYREYFGDNLTSCAMSRHSRPWEIRPRSAGYVARPY